MKTLLAALVISLFSVSAAHACDGMKDHAQKTSDTQAKKDPDKASKKDDVTKS